MGCGLARKNRFESLVSPDTVESSSIHRFVPVSLFLHLKLRQKTLFTVKEVSSYEEISSMK